MYDYIQRMLELCTKMTLYFIMPIFYFWWALAYIHAMYLHMYDLNARLWLVISELSGRVLDCHQEMHVPNTERSAHCYNRLGTLKELSHFQPDISVSVNWVGTSLYSELRLRTWILILGSCIVLMLLRLDSFLSWFIFVRWGRATKWFIGSLDQCTVSEPFTEVWSVPLYKYIQYLEKYFIAM